MLEICAALAATLLLYLLWKLIRHYSGKMRLESENVALVIMYTVMTMFLTIWLVGGVVAEANSPELCCHTGAEYE